MRDRVVVYLSGELFGKFGIGQSPLAGIRTPRPTVVELAGEPVLPFLAFPLASRASSVIRRLHPPVSLSFVVWYSDVLMLVTSFLLEKATASMAKGTAEKRRGFQCVRGGNLAYGSPGVSIGLGRHACWRRDFEVPRLWCVAVRGERRWR